MSARGMTSKNAKMQRQADILSKMDKNFQKNLTSERQKSGPKNWWKYMPPAAIINVVGNWLGVVDIVRLNTAITSRKHRDVLVAIYDNIFCHGFHKYEFKTIASLMWCLTRNLNISGFTLNLRGIPEHIPSFQFICSQNLYIMVEWLISRVAIEQGPNTLNINDVVNFRMSERQIDMSMTALQYAALNSWMPMIKVLCKIPGINVNIPGGAAMQTPLHEAVTQRNLNIIRHLIHEGHADVNALTELRNTPLYLACKDGQDDIVEELLNNGAFVNQPCDDGYTALHISALKGHQRIVKTLVDHKADANIQTITYQATPLHLACSINNRRIVRVLVASGNANVYIINSLGWSPYTMDPKGFATLLKELGQPVQHQAPPTQYKAPAKPVVPPHITEPIINETHREAHAPSIVVDGSNSLDEESAHKLSEESTESADAKIDEPRYVVYQNEGHIETELGPDGNPLAGSKRQRKPSQRMKGDIVVPASAALKNYTQPVLLTARELSAYGLKAGPSGTASASVGPARKKRGRGRPRKYPLSGDRKRMKMDDSEDEYDDEDEEETPEMIAEREAAEEAHKKSEIERVKKEAALQALSVVLPRRSAESLGIELPDLSIPKAARPYDKKDPIELRYMPTTMIYTSLPRLIPLNEIPVLFKKYTQLPQCIIKHIVGNYLTADEAGRLDSATSQRNAREILKECFKGLLSSNFDNFKYFSLRSIQWVLRQGIDVRNFRLYFINNGYKCGGNALFKYLCTMEWEDVALAVVQKCYDGEVCDANAISEYSLNNEKRAMTPLIYASALGHTTVVDMLVYEARVEVDFALKDKTTALFLSVTNGHLDCVKLLCSSGCVDLAQLSPFGETLLRIAIYKGHPNIALQLIKSGADPGQMNGRGLTALHMASETGDIALCRTILQFGVDINHQCNSGRTALHYAAIANFLDICRMLILEYGANPHISDNEGVASTMFNGINEIIAFSKERHNLEVPIHGKLMVQRLAEIRGISGITGSLESALEKKMASVSQIQQQPKMARIKSILSKSMFDNVQKAARGFKPQSKVNLAEPIIVPRDGKNFIPGLIHGLPGAPILGIRGGSIAPLKSQGISAPLPYDTTLDIENEVKKEGLTYEQEVYNARSLSQKIQHERPILGDEHRIALVKRQRKFAIAGGESDIDINAPVIVQPEYDAALNLIEPFLKNADAYFVPMKPRDLEGDAPTRNSGPINLWNGLPPKIYKNICSNFLSVQDMCHLELAFGSSKERDSLMNSYYATQFPSIDSYKKKNLHFMKWCLKRRIDISNFKPMNDYDSTDGMPLFHYACKERALDVMAALYMQCDDIDINATFQYTGELGALTPLQYAYYMEHWGVVRFLLIFCKASACGSDIYGNTLLHFAVEEGNIDLALLFIRHGNADANAVGSRGYTPLHWAAKYGHVEIARILVIVGKAKASLSAQNNAGQTPLHIALKESHAAMCHLLIGEFWVNVNISDKKGRRAIDIANQYTLPENIVHLVKEANVLHRRIDWDV
jgi:ankyrin repeat protein